MEITSRKLFYFSAISIIVLILLIHLLPTKAISVYTSTFILTSIIFILFSTILIKSSFSHNHIILILVLTFLLKLSFINTQPIGSDDIYRYMWDGKLQASGINPYQFTPNDSALDILHTELLPSKVNFPDLKTIYFPLSEWLFFTGYKISGESVWGYKFLLFLFEIFTIIFLYLLLKKLNKETKYLLLYALCPLIIFQFSIDAHLDGFGVTLLAAALYFYFSKKKILSLIFLGLSFSIKPIGILFLPILFLDQKKIVDKFFVVLFPILIFGIQFIPYLFTSNPFEALFLYTANWSFNGFIFKLLYILIQNNQTTRLICSIILMIVLIPIYLSKRDLITKFYFALLLLYLFSPVVHPWYIGWIVLLIAVTQLRSGIYYAALSSLTSITIYNYVLYGTWKDYWPVLIIEYSPVIFFMIIEIFFNNRSTTVNNQSTLHNSQLN